MPFISHLQLTHQASQMLAAAPANCTIHLRYFALGDGPAPKQPRELQHLQREQLRVEVQEAQLNGLELRATGRLPLAYEQLSFYFPELGLFAQIGLGPLFLLGYAHAHATNSTFQEICESEIDAILRLSQRLPLSTALPEPNTNDLPPQTQPRQDNSSPKEAQFESLHVADLYLDERIISDCQHNYCDRAYSLYIQEAKALGIAQTDDGSTHDIVFLGQDLTATLSREFKVEIDHNIALRLCFDEMADHNVLIFEGASGQSLNLDDSLCTERLQVHGTGYKILAPAQDEQSQALAMRLEGGLSADHIRSQSLPSGISFRVQGPDKAQILAHFGQIHFELKSQAKPHGFALQIFARLAPHSPKANRGIEIQLEGRSERLRTILTLSEEACLLFEEEFESGGAAVEIQGLCWVY